MMQMFFAKTSKTKSIFTGLRDMIVHSIPIDVLSWSLRNGLRSRLTKPGIGIREGYKQKGKKTKVRRYLVKSAPGHRQSVNRGK